MNGLYKEENVSQPDNTINTLLKILGAVKQSGVDLPSGYRTPNALLRSPVPTTESTVVPDFRAEVAPAPEITPPTINNVTPPVLPDATPVIPTTPSNALLGATTPVTAPETKKPTNTLLDYWAKPVIGKMPLDQFVQIAGALSSAIAPREWSGRVGNVLSQMGGAAYAERVKREGEELERQRKEPENVLRRRLLGAQITEAETPKEWGAFSKSLRGTVDPDTQRPYTEGKILQKFHEATRAPKEPKVPTEFETYLKGSEAERALVEKYKGLGKEGKILSAWELFSTENAVKINPETNAPYTSTELIGTFNKITEKSGVGIEEKYDPKTQITSGRDYKLDSKGNKTYTSDWRPIKGRVSAIDKEITPIQYWGIVSKIEDDARSYANVTVPKAANQVTFPAGGGIVIGSKVAEEDVKKWVKAYQDHYSRKVGEAKRMGALPKDYEPKSITEEPLPGTLTDIIYEGSKATGKIVPRAIVPEKIFKDKQGREMIKDPTSSTGWRYK